MHSLCFGLTYVVAVTDRDNLEQERWEFGADSDAALEKFFEIYNQGHCDHLAFKIHTETVSIQIVEFLEQHPNPSITGLACVCPVDAHNHSLFSGRLIRHYSSTLTEIGICTCGGIKDCWKSIKLCDKLELLSTYCHSNEAVPGIEKATQEDVLEALKSKSLRGFFIDDITVKSGLSLCKQNAQTLTRLGFERFGGGATHYSRPFDVSWVDGFWRFPKLFPTLPSTFVKRIGAIPGFSIGIKWLLLRYNFSEFQEQLMAKYRERVAAIPKLFPNLTHLILFSNDHEEMDEQAAKMLIEAFLNIPAEEERLIRMYLLMPGTELPWKMMEEGKCRRIEKKRTDPSHEHCTRIVKGNIIVLLRVDGVVESENAFFGGRFHLNQL